MRDKKKIVIGVLCALVGIMAVGYAALATRLNITGTASIDSTWKVEITNITESNIVGDATSKETPSYTATTANFSVGLIQPTDSITYDIEISNLGTLKAKVDSIQVVMDENDAITYTTSGVEEGDKLGVGEKDTLSVTVVYNPEVTSQPTVTAKDITVTINYVQDLGTNAGTDTPSVTYEAYSIGDTVSFAGSNWYVIKNSTSDEDYVTLLKETAVTSLGQYYTMDGGYSGMEYYWDDTCHSGRYGYGAAVTTGCSEHNDYEGSKVKEFLEGTYINTLGPENLKEVDGYKIRLLSREDSINNLGFDVVETSNGPSLFATENVPQWVYQNFGSNNAYWTMGRQDPVTPEVITTDGGSVSKGVSIVAAVRPVINLLKSSIE